MANITKITTGWNEKKDKKDKRSVAEVVDELKNIEKEYAYNDHVDAPDSLNLSKVEVPNKTEEELTEAAKNSLKDKYEKKQQTTNQSFSKQIESLLQSKENLKEQNEQDKEEINTAYDNSIKATENQALKRGLARSSIVISQISSLEGGRAKELSQSLKELEDKLSEAENKITSLEKEQQDALDNLEIEYAIELEQELQKAKDEYQKSVKEAIDFNNNVDKLEAEYKLKLDKQKQDKQQTLTELKEKYDTSYTFEQMRDAQFDYLKDYLTNIEKDYALELLLTNKDIRTYLGNRYREMYDLISKS